MANMRKIGSLLLSLALLFALAMPVHAEGEAETATETETTTESEPASAGTVVLSIENQNVYEGMNTAYKSGYAPTVANGVATVILPLQASGPLQNDQLTATVDLGDTSSTAFVFLSYEQSFSLEEHTINGTEETAACYLVRFDLTLALRRHNGVYPVTITVTARDTAGNDISQSFTCYVTIQDGIDPNATEETTVSAAVEETTEETPTSKPVVLVSGSVINPDPVNAGESFTALITLQNTSTLKAVQNMVILATCESADFTLLSDSNAIYVASLGAGETMQLELKYRVSTNAAAGQYTISLALSYDNPDAVTLSSSGSISVQVQQPIEVELTMPNIDSTVNAGDTLPLSFQVMNLGRSKVYNVRVTISGDGLLPTSTGFIGDMEPGTEGTAALNLFIGTKDMTEGYTGTEQYGSTTGTVTLIYEDESGTEYTQTETFTTYIEKSVTVVAASDDSEEEEQRASQWWVAFLVLGGILVVGGVGAGAYYLGRRRS
ncbi:MAG: hypothetical protein LUD79_01465 [Oscillospiraceae bacterium]|nr:hypothetical protein [Oscillospiraceae bacterium]